jgi:hypothetical protein
MAGLEEGRWEGELVTDLGISGYRFQMQILQSQSSEDSQSEII